MQKNKKALPIFLRRKNKKNLAKTLNTRGSVTNIFLQFETKTKIRRNKQNS